MCLSSKRRKCYASIIKEVYFVIGTSGISIYLSIELHTSLLHQLYVNKVYSNSMSYQLEQLTSSDRITIQCSHTWGYVLFCVLLIEDVIVKNEMIYNEDIE